MVDLGELFLIESTLSGLSKDKSLLYECSELTEEEERIVSIWMGGATVLSGWDSSERGDGGVQGLSLFEFATRLGRSRWAAIVAREEIKARSCQIRTSPLVGRAVVTRALIFCVVREGISCKRSPIS